MSSISLQQLLLPDFRNSNEVILNLSAPKEDIEQIHQKIKTHIQEAEWPGIQDTLFSHLEDLLNTPLEPILTTSWHKLSEISQIKEQQKKSGSTKPKTVPLYNHSIESKHKPKLQILMNNKIIHTIPLTVILKLDLKGVELEIAQGEIQKIKSGNCKGKGEIYYNKAKLHERNILEFKLPGSVSLSSNEAAESSQPIQQIHLHNQIESAPEPQQTSNNWNWIAYVLLGVLFLVLGVLIWMIF